MLVKTGCSYFSYLFPSNALIWYPKVGSFEDEDTGLDCTNDPISKISDPKMYYVVSVLDPIFYWWIVRGICWWWTCDCWYRLRASRGAWFLQDRCRWWWSLPALIANLYRWWCVLQDRWRRHLNQRVPTLMYMYFLRPGFFATHWSATINTLIGKKWQTSIRRRTSDFGEACMRASNRWRIRK